jgi:hypothetical protein
VVGPQRGPTPRCSWSRVCSRPCPVRAPGSRLLDPVPGPGSRLLDPVPGPGSRLPAPVPGPGSRLPDPVAGPGSRCPARARGGTAAVVALRVWPRRAPPTRHRKGSSPPQLRHSRECGNPGFPSSASRPSMVRKPWTGNRNRGRARARETGTGAGGGARARAMGNALPVPLGASRLRGWRAPPSGAHLPRRPPAAPTVSHPDIRAGTM